jgi:rhamnosyltransferase
MNAGNENTAVVIVLYNPTAEDLAFVGSMAASHDGVVVDNSPAPLTDSGAIGRMRYLHEPANVGIAKAQNDALDILKRQPQTSYYVFLDQDSRVGADYPQQIADEFARMRNTTGNLALLGPTVRHKDDGEEYRSAFHKYQQLGDGLEIRREIISSGSCMSREALETVGANDASLFIDYVDFEWCWRAKAKGLVCGITPRVSILHQVGNRELALGKYKVILSAPNRYFYQYRNYLWLVRRKYVPLQWKLVMGCKYALRLIYFPLCVNGGKRCWKHMLKGMQAGLGHTPAE